MSTELIAIISVGVALAGLVITMVGLLLTVLRGMQKEMQSLREITTNLLGRVAHVEGLLEGLREAFTGWRADAVAEAPEQYEPR